MGYTACLVVIVIETCRRRPRERQGRRCYIDLSGAAAAQSPIPQSAGLCLIRISYQRSTGLLTTDSAGPAVPDRQICHRPDGRAASSRSKGGASGCSCQGQASSPWPMAAVSRPAQAFYPDLRRGQAWSPAMTWNSGQADGVVFDPWRRIADSQRASLGSCRESIYHRPLGHQLRATYYHCATDRQIHRCREPAISGYEQRLRLHRCAQNG